MRATAFCSLMDVPHNLLVPMREHSHWKSACITTQDFPRCSAKAPELCSINGVKTVHTSSNTIPLSLWCCAAEAHIVVVRDVVLSVRRTVVEVHVDAIKKML